MPSLYNRFVTCNSFLGEPSTDRNAGEQEPMNEAIIKRRWFAYRTSQVPGDPCRPRRSAVASQVGVS
jgi:hypothetical protein